MKIPIHDAHNHFHDVRLAGHREAIFETLALEGLTTMVVNGTCEEDWSAVRALAAAHGTLVIPCFGLHPWQVARRTRDWKDRLIAHLEAPSARRAGLGEIGLDKWMRHPDLEDQTGVFVEQLRIAAARDLPVTIHCLRAWGTLIEILEREPLPSRGFLLHAYGGPAELTGRLIARGAFFSFNGHFLHEHKRAQREVFRALPIDRLLVETDAPDMSPPVTDAAYHLPHDDEGKPVNHPGNIRMLHEALAHIREMPAAEMAGRLDENFKRLFE